MSHPDFVPQILDHVLYWIRERESMRVRKEAGAPWPWTSDPFMREWRWCNVRRMDDRVSRELMASWYPHDATPAVQLLAAVLARNVNWTDALMEATSGQPFDIDALPQIRERLHARMRRGDKVFTGAYIVPGEAGRLKVDSVCDLAERIRVATDLYHPPCVTPGVSSLPSMDSAPFSPGRSSPTWRTCLPVAIGLMARVGHQ